MSSGEPRGRGGVIELVGPDGAGKSTLREAVENRVLSGLPVLPLHHRPAILPARTRSPVTDPHSHPPYGVGASIAKILYVYIDYALGWVARLRPFVKHGGWVVLERGWWDMAVDPRRYRLRAGTWLIRLLGRTLPNPDLVIILEAEPRLLATRKRELPLAELEEQLEAWRTVLPPRQRRLRLDASLPREELVSRTAREIAVEVDGALGRSAWVNLPSRRRPRWVLPRDPRASARAALHVYQPPTPGRRAVWQAVRVLAGWGLFRLLPRGQPPAAELWLAIRKYIPRGSAIAAAKLNHPGRYGVLVLDVVGRRHAFAKVGLDAADAGGLVAEARNIAAFAPRLPDPLVGPRILGQDDKLLLLEAAQWRARLRPWRLPDEVAFALGAFFRGGAGAGTKTGLTHGDFAPWNLLRTGHGWVVVDWEQADPAGPRFHDLFHYLVQAHALLGRPTRRQLISGIGGRGWVGGAIRSYAEGGHIPNSEARAALISYLESSQGDLDPSTEEGSRGIRAREALLQALGVPRMVRT